MDNARYAEVLEEIARLIELTGGGAFRARSFHRAARTVRDLASPIEDLIHGGASALTALPGIGASTARDLAQIAERGTCDRLDELREEVPSAVTRLLEIPGLGPRKAMLLHQRLGVADIEDLRRACEAQRVRSLPGMGAKSEARILDGIRVHDSVADRTPLLQAQGQVDALVAHLANCSEIRRHTVAGSFRRRRESVGDLDVLVVAADRDAASEAILAYPTIDQVIQRGTEKLSLRLASGLQVDVRFVEEAAFGAALISFTGSKAHNIALRQRALDRGWKLNEYGLFSGTRRLAGRTEEQVYRRLDLAWIPPELREARGEIAAAAQQDGAPPLPRLVEPGDIRGDLHAHTTASDGTASIQTMAETARARGYSYLAITDHSRALSVIGGLDEERLLRQAAEVRAIDATLERFWLLAGIEVDILQDGTLDLDPAVLAGLDWVVASVHSYFSQDGATMTRRLLRAIGSGVVHCLGHPFARRIGHRPPLSFDREAVFHACREHGVFLEINANPERLDLPDTAVRQARDLGVSLVIDTDAHAPAHFAFMPLGVDIARRGWLTADQVLNTATIPQLRRRLRRTG